MTDQADDRYEQPSGDEPLDAVEWAIVRALAAMFVKQIREELAATEQLNRTAQRAGDPECATEHP